MACGFPEVMKTLNFIESESETVEFKSSFGKEVIISLVAFANTHGGKVYVGVDNSGNPNGKIKINDETLLLNAVIHRDYKMASDIVVKIFDDRILFLSLGRLYGNQSLQDLERDDYVSIIRNKLLAESFYLLGEIEKYGTGFLRIRKHLHGEYASVQLLLKEQADFFSVELSITPPITPSKRGDKKECQSNVEPLSDLEGKILDMIRKHSTMSFAEMAKQLGIGRDTVKEYVNRLKIKGLVRRHGSTRSGYWEVLK